MNAMTCERWASIAGWNCKPVGSADSTALCITTPLTLPGGKPMDFYLQEEAHSQYEMTDDGLTMFALRGLGYALDDRRNWRGLEALATQHGFELTERGEIRASVPEDRVTEYSGRILQLFSSILAWEAEKFSDADSDFALTAEVERLLRMRDGSRPLLRDVTVQTRAADVTFNFQWGDTYVDASASSGAGSRRS